ncbi:MAG: hypothetical protein Q8Q90_00140, partial [bacterium]|nr:hypothetical protein [bacterium]
YRAYKRSGNWMYSFLVGFPETSISMVAILIILISTTIRVISAPVCYFIEQMRQLPEIVRLWRSGEIVNC